MSEHILSSKEGSIGLISINRSGSMNSLLPEVMVEFIDALHQLEKDKEIRAIIIGGEGKHFSVGGDFEALYNVAKMKPAEIKETVYTYFAGGVEAIYNCSTPTIAAVRGFAYGAGCELTLACDFRIASETALFCETWVNIGLSPALGGMVTVARLVGQAKAAEILLLGDPIKGKDAAEMGLAYRVVADGQLEIEAHKLAQRLADKPPLAVQVIKEGMRRGAESSISKERNYAVYAQATLLSSDDYLEGINAVRQKRKPVFKGS